MWCGPGTSAACWRRATPRADLGRAIGGGETSDCPSGTGDGRLAGTILVVDDEADVATVHGRSAPRGSEPGYWPVSAFVLKTSSWRGWSHGCVTSTASGGGA